MARQTFIKLVDDIDGTEAHETVMFAIDGLSYEIDLSNKNAAKLRLAFQPYVENGTRTKAVAGKKRIPAQAERTTPPKVDRVQSQAIRAWAIRKGLDVAPRGRIRADIVERYHAEAGTESGRSSKSGR